MGTLRRMVKSVLRPGLHLPLTLCCSLHSFGTFMDLERNVEGITSTKSCSQMIPIWKTYLNLIDDDIFMRTMLDFNILENAIFHFFLISGIW